MLGKDHVRITVAFSLPFIIFFFIAVVLTGIPIWAAIVFPVCLIIGSLLPDADCGGKPTLYYEFYPIYLAMKPINLFAYLTMRLFFRKYAGRRREMLRAHRGILHSLTGIFLSSAVLAVIFSLVCSVFAFLVIAAGDGSVPGEYILSGDPAPEIVLSLLIQISDDILNALTEIVIFFLTVFIGLFSGQFMHLYEDSCTKSGIRWFLPFSGFRISGHIRTITDDDDAVPDTRPAFFRQTFLRTGIAGSLLLLTVQAVRPEQILSALAAVFLLQAGAAVYLYLIARERPEKRKWYQVRKRRIIRGRSCRPPVFRPEKRMFPVKDGCLSGSSVSCKDQLSVRSGHG